VVNAFVDQALAAVTDARVALIGDFNEFSFLAPLQVLAGGDDDAPVDEGGSSELAVTEGSGGCTMGNGRDASLPILLLLATIILVSRRRKTRV